MHRSLLAKLQPGADVNFSIVIGMASRHSLVMRPGFTVHGSYTIELELYEPVEAVNWSLARTILCTDADANIRSLSISCRSYQIVLPPMSLLIATPALKHQARSSVNAFSRHAVVSIQRTLDERCTSIRLTRKSLTTAGRGERLSLFDTSVFPWSGYILALPLPQRRPVTHSVKHLL